MVYKGIFMSDHFVLFLLSKLDFCSMFASDNGGAHVQAMAELAQ